MTLDWSTLHPLVDAALLAALLAWVIWLFRARRGDARRAERRLAEQAARYRLIVEQSPDAIWLAGNGRLQLVNAACVHLLGAHSPHDLLGRALSDFLPEPLPAQRLPGASSGPPSPRETRARRLDGQWVEVELSLADVPEHGGAEVQGVMRDISGRKQAEADLRNTQAALLQAQQIARLGYATLDRTSGQWSISPALADLLGLPGGTTLRYDDGWQVVHPDDRAALTAHLENEVFTGRRPYDHEYRILRRDTGELRWLHAVGRVERDDDGRVVRLFATVQDVTERKLATLALERSREELRRLSTNVTWARETERRHVARELHDELGQRLSVLKLDLATLLAVPMAQQEECAPRLQQLVNGVDGALAATRRIAADLRPSMLDDLGLNAALEWLSEGWSQRTGITISVDGDPVEDTLTEAAAITVYRIVQEALTNVTRHAQAKHAHIELRQRGPEIVLVIEDDGRGLSPGDMDKRESSGLAGIRERARILGGTAWIDNRPAGGCRLEVRLPMERVDSTLGALERAS
jgi:PAS domain S-box-containing protein